MKHSQPVTTAELSSIASTRRFTTKAAVAEYLRGDKLECFICGKLFVNLGGHVVRAHGVPVRDYKVYFNIPRTAGLVTARLIEHWRDCSNEPRRLEQAREAGRINGKLPRSHATLSPAPVYEDVNRRGNARILPPVEAPATPPAKIEDFQLQPNGRFAVPPVSKPRANPFIAQGYDKKTLVARVERLEKALKCLLNASQLALLQLLDD